MGIQGDICTSCVSPYDWLWKPFRCRKGCRKGTFSPDIYLYGFIWGNLFKGCLGFNGSSRGGVLALLAALLVLLVPLFYRKRIFQGLAFYPLSQFYFWWFVSRFVWMT